ncbi:MAG: NAD(P)H-dependent oxidoreductase [Lachnospiraceae bacterium]|nr:NAD(P)H-dependent oxidoreductase [Lachnospiraceae bacterium]
MKVLVLNGSPKGEYSITLQTVKYIQKNAPTCSFEVLHVGQRIKALEKDFSPAIEALKSADMLVFAYPVYTFMAPCQLHRFIELVKASGVDLSGKYATQVTTSKHFYDVTAHRYIQDNCMDLGLKFIKGLSADMEDLLEERGQQEALKFWEYVMWAVKEEIYERAVGITANYAPHPVEVPEAKTQPAEGDVVIVTDCEADDIQLKNMIARFQAVLHRKSRVVNIWEYPLRGGCLGCFNCAVDGKCIYTDGFDEFLRTDIQSAESIIYAFTIKDHSMGATFKMYDDRQFCNGHRTVTSGMPMGYIISGSLSTEINVQTIVEARSQVGGNFLAGVATDEADPNVKIDQLAKSLEYALANKHRMPQNFYGIGGMKIFRDLIWTMQGMMKADHKFFKAHGQYDFPQKKRGTMLKMYLVGAMLANPAIKAKMGNKMNEGMIAPYKKIVE